MESLKLYKKYTENIYTYIYQLDRALIYCNMCERQPIYMQE